jgi:purine-cytosine permease-like protein
LTFRPFSATFSIFHKGAKTAKKAIAFTLSPFLADFSIFKKEAKNRKKVIALTFVHF